MDNTLIIGIIIICLIIIIIIINNRQSEHFTNCEQANFSMDMKFSSPKYLYKYSNNYNSRFFMSINCCSYYLYESTKWNIDANITTWDTNNTRWVFIYVCMDTKFVCSNIIYINYKYIRKYSIYNGKLWNTN